jgi:hypothetical protein
MSPSSSPVLHSRRPRRPSRPSRGRNRPLERVAISTVVRSALVVTAVWLIATGTYFAFSGDVLTRLIGRQNTTYEDHIAELRAQIDRIESSKFLDQLTALQQRQAKLERRTSALTGDLSATGTIKPERIAPTEATPAEKPTPASPINDTAIFFAPPEGEARLQLPKLPASTLPASTTTKQHRRAAHHRASLRHRIAPPGATPAEQSPQLTSITKPDPGLANQ